MRLFVYYVIGIYSTLLSRRSDVVLSLFIVLKFILEMWWDLSHHRVEGVAIPETFFQKYLYPGYVMILSSMFATLICWLFQYPSLFEGTSSSFVSLSNDTRSSTVSRRPSRFRTMILVSMLFTLLSPVMDMRFVHGIAHDASTTFLIEFSTMIVCFMFTCLYGIESCYRCTFGRCSKNSMLAERFSEEHRNINYAMIFGEIGSIIVYGSLASSPLVSDRSYRNTLETYTKATLLSSIGSSILCCILGRKSQEAKMTSPMIEEESPHTTFEFDSSMPSVVGPIQTTTENPSSFQRDRPPVSSLRLSSVRRRQC